MAFDKLSGLPEWDDDEFEDDENEGEEWKPKPTKEAAKAMYEQWKTVMIVLKGALGSMDADENEEQEQEDPADNDGFPSSFWKDHKGMILGDAYQVAVKIKSSEAGLYMIRMENACLIRKNAQSIKSSMLTLIAEKVIEESHGMIIRDEIDKFRILFRHWVSTFERDEFEDEWGLF